MATASEPAEPDLSGQVLDRYKLTECLGMGGMGAVYGAVHTKLDTKVAVKLLRHEFTMQEIARKRFLREAKAAARVKHPNVVDISDFGETPDGRVYFVMELMAGEDLGDLLKREPKMSWPRARGMLLQIASALEAAHSHGIVHRDMKPSNCFLVNMPGLQGADYVKVLDFGIAKFDRSSGEETEGLTSTDEVFGTVAYMSPEMAMGTTNDIRSDIYAVGVMMYRMLVGALPFNEGNAFQILTQHINTNPPRPRHEEPSIPEGVEEIILRALQKDVKFRFQTMREFAEALELGRLPAGPAGGTQMVSPVPTGAPAIDATMALATDVTGQASGGPDRTEALSMDTGHAATASGSGATGVRATGAAGGTAGQAGIVAGTGATVAVSASGRVPMMMQVGPDGATGTYAVPVQGKARAVPIVLIVLVGLGIVMGAVALGIYIARGSGDGSSTVAAAPADTPAPGATPVVKAEVAPSAAAEPPAQEPVKPEPTAAEGADAGASPVPASPDSEPAAVPTEPEQAEPEPVKKKASTRKKPKSDGEVIAGLKRKLAARCTDAGDTSVRLEGFINTEGRIDGVMVTPSTGVGACAKKILRSTRFRARNDSVMLPVVTVKL